MTNACLSYCIYIYYIHITVIQFDITSNRKISFPESKQILCLVLVVLHFQYVNEKSDTQFQNDM